jgi:O-antigen ligase
MGRRTQQRAIRLLGIGYVVLLIGGAIGWAGLQSTVTRFSSSQADMLDGRWPAWRDTASIIADFPVFGTGPGTYWMAMLIYQTGDRTAFYEEAHNDYLQVAAEGGVLLAVPVACAIVFGVAEIRRRFREADAEPVRHWIRIGAVGGLIGIGTQSVVEFTLQMPGTRVLFITLAAIAMHRRDRVKNHAHRV